MSTATRNLAVEIVRFVGDRFPGWVECEFFDTEGHKQTFIDKVPVFTSEKLDATSKCLLIGTVKCVVLN